MAYTHTLKPYFIGLASLCCLATACGQAEELPQQEPSNTSTSTSGSNSATANTARVTATAVNTGRATATSRPSSTTSTSSSSTSSSSNSSTSTSSSTGGSSTGRQPLPIDRTGWDLLEIPRSKRSDGRMKSFKLDYAAHHRLKNQDNVLLIAQQDPVVFDFGEVTDIYIKSQTSPSCLVKWPYQKLAFHLDSITNDGGSPALLTQGAASTQVNILANQAAQGQVSFGMVYQDGPLRKFDQNIKDPATLARCEDIWGVSRTATNTAIDYTWNLDVKPLHKMQMGLPDRCTGTRARGWAVAGAGPVTVNYTPFDEDGASLVEARNWNGSDPFEAWYKKSEAPVVEGKQLYNRSLQINVPEVTAPIAKVELESRSGDIRRLYFVPKSDVHNVDVALYRLQSDNLDRLKYTPGFQHDEKGKNGRVGIDIGIASVVIKSASTLACNFDYKVEVTTSTPAQCEASNYIVHGHGLRPHPYSTGRSIKRLKAGLCEFTVSLPELGITKQFSVTF